MDCLIPLHKKDLDCVGYCIDSVQRYLPEVETIWIASAIENRPAIEAIPGEHRFLDERVLLDEIAPGNDETDGWLVQQMLKLGGHVLSGDPHWLVVDADTIFLRPMTFIDGSRSILTPDPYRRPGTCEQYCRAYSVLMGVPMAHQQCFIAHHMVFNRGVVEQLLSRIRFRPWWAPLQRLRACGPLPFSEYDFYASFLSTEYPERLSVRDAGEGDWLNLPWRWWDDRAATTRLLDTLGAMDWCYVSCHHYLRSVAVEQDFILRFAGQPKTSGGSAAFGDWLRSRRKMRQAGLRRRLRRAWHRRRRSLLLAYRLWFWRRRVTPNPARAV